MKYFTSDLHLGHENVIEFAERPFKSLDEMNDTIMTKLVEPLRKNDSLYILGDIAWNKTVMRELCARLPYGVDVFCNKGNHDSSKVLKPNDKIKEVYMMKEIKIGDIRATLCHYPMKVWNESHHNSFDLFGHIHRNEEFRQFELNGKMLNVNCEFHNFVPWNEDEIIEYMKNQPDNFDAINYESFTG